MKKFLFFCSSLFLVFFSTSVIGQFCPYSKTGTKCLNEYNIGCYAIGEVCQTNGSANVFLQTNNQGCTGQTIVNDNSFIMSWTNNTAHCIFSYEVDFFGQYNLAQNFNEHITIGNHTWGNCKSP